MSQDPEDKPIAPTGDPKKEDPGTALKNGTSGEKPINPFLIKPVKEPVKCELLDSVMEDLGDKILEASCFKERRPQIIINPSDILFVARYLRDSAMFDHLSCISAVDHEDRFEMVYHFFSWQSKNLITVKAGLEKLDEPEIDSLCELWEAANWHEREAYDLMGIRFSGHPDLKRILMYDGFQGYPLRKEFKLEEASWYDSGEE